MCHGDWRVGDDMTELVLGALTDRWQVKAPLLGAVLPRDSHLSAQVKARHR